MQPLNDKETTKKRLSQVDGAEAQYVQHWWQEESEIMRQRIRKNEKNR
jgi:hypothetical protein